MCRHLLVPTDEVNDRLLAAVHESVLRHPGMSAFAPLMGIKQTCRRGRDFYEYTP